MSDKKRANLLSAFSEEAARPAASLAGASRPSAPRIARRGARAQGDRLNLSFRMTPATWERVKQLALSDRISVQELLFISLSREFERRGLPALSE